MEPAVWRYEVSGKQVLRPWFSDRKANRGRMTHDEFRLPNGSDFDIRTSTGHWLAEYTTELLNWSIRAPPRIW